jgi:cell cycle arrest protein BUB3
MTEVPGAPDEVISSLKFSPTGNQLLVGSWDGFAHVYDTDGPGTLLVKADFGGPVTAVSWSGNKPIVATVDGGVFDLDLENGRKGRAIASHSEGVQSLVSIDSNIVISGSWDKSVLYSDIRSREHPQKVGLPGKVFAMDATKDHLVVAMDERMVHVYDHRQLDVPLQIRESGLRYQTRALKCMPDGKGYAQSSIEGRVAIELLDASQAVQERKYAFKCHRLSADDADLVSPVNALCFHETYGTLFTGGSDNHVCLWDHVARKRLRQYSRLDLPVVSMDFKNNILAIATSDDSFKTSPSLESDIVPNYSRIFLKQLKDGEGVPKVVPDSK